MSSNDKKIIKAIATEPVSLPQEEAQAEMDSTTADDYNDWIMNSLHARAIGRIQRDGEGENAEHPTARLFRIGIESIRNGKPSDAFLALLELIAERAEESDVLHKVFRDTFPKAITQKQMKAAENSIWIVDEFRRYVKSVSQRTEDFSSIKERFKIDMQSLKSPQDPIHPKTIDRALDSEGLSFSAKRGRKSGRR